MLALRTTPLQVVSTVVWEAQRWAFSAFSREPSHVPPHAGDRSPPDLSFLCSDFTMFRALMRPVLRSIEP
jgi:hypothetical protein